MRIDYERAWNLLKDVIEKRDKKLVGKKQLLRAMKDIELLEAQKAHSEYKHTSHRCAVHRLCNASGYFRSRCGGINVKQRKALLVRVVHRYEHRHRILVLGVYLWLESPSASVRMDRSMCSPTRRKLDRSHHGTARATSRLRWIISSNRIRTNVKGGRCVHVLLFSVPLHACLAEDRAQQ